MRLRHFKKLVFDTHIKLVNKYGHELAYLSEFTSYNSSKYDDCVVIKFHAIDYRVIEVMIVRDRLPGVKYRR